MTRFLLPALAAALLAPGLALAEGEADLEVGAIQYYYCTVNGGEEIWEAGDDIRICQYPDGDEIWCDADYTGCEFIIGGDPNEHPGPGNPASSTTSTTGTATQAPGGGFGTAATLNGGVQLQIQH